MIHGVLEGAGQQLLRSLDRQESRIGIDVLVAGHLLSGLRAPTLHDLSSNSGLAA
jgi:hypothetical protein